MLQERGLDYQLRMALSLPPYPYDHQLLLPRLGNRYLFFWALSRTTHVTPVLRRPLAGVYLHLLAFFGCGVHAHRHRALDS